MKNLFILFIISLVPISSLILSGLCIHWENPAWESFLIVSVSTFISVASVASSMVEKDSDNKKKDTKKKNKKKNKNKDKDKDGDDELYGLDNCPPVD